MDCGRKKDVRLRTGRGAGRNLARAAENQVPQDPDRDRETPGDIRNMGRRTHSSKKGWHRGLRGGVDGSGAAGARPSAAHPGSNDGYHRAKARRTEFARQPSQVHGNYRISDGRDCSDRQRSANCAFKSGCGKDVLCYGRRSAGTTAGPLPSGALSRGSSRACKAIRTHRRHHSSNGNAGFGSRAALHRRGVSARGIDFAT